MCGVSSRGHYDSLYTFCSPWACVAFWNQKRGHDKSKDQKYMILWGPVLDDVMGMGCGTSLRQMAGRREPKADEKEVATKQKLLQEITTEMIAMQIIGSCVFIGLYEKCVENQCLVDDLDNYSAFYNNGSKVVL